MKAKILDTTLRDGNYVVDFQFTPHDTIEIASALESFGFEYIEIGHGLGLNASNCGKGIAAATDREYMKAVSSILKKARWGMFFIPGIGRFEDIDLAADYKMGFIRIGTNITESEAGLEYITRAKKKGMLVFANLMKSYAVKPKEFARRARMAEDAGADIVSLVDSAGGMFPEDIERYFNETKKITKIKLGIHAHNNLQLGIANSLRAIKCGAYMVDTCLQGLGRGGGNTSTEVLLTTLSRRNISEDFDLRLYDLLDFSENFVKPMLKEKGIDALSLISGYAQFHSSYLPIVKKYAERYQIDPRKLIVELCKIDVVNAPEVIVQQIADRLKKEAAVEIPKRHFNKKLYDVIRETQDTSLRKELDIVLKDISIISRKFNKQSVFNIAVPVNKDESLISRLIQESSSFIIGTAEIVNLEDLKLVANGLDGKVDAVIYDVELKIKDSAEMFDFMRKNIKRSTLLFYRNTEIWAKAIENTIIQLSSELRKKVLLVGESILTLKLAGALSDIGFKTFIYGRGNNEDMKISQVKFSETVSFAGESNESFDIIVGLGPYTGIVDSSFKNKIAKNGILIDGWIGTISEEMVDFALERGMQIIRVDMRGVLDAEIRSKMNSYELVNNVAGKRTIDGIECVAGGVYGKENAVVLDSIKNPRCVIGLADGKGKVKYVLTEDEKRIVERIEEDLFLSKGILEEDAL